MKKSILLVDDSLADVLLTERAIEDCGIPHWIHVAGDGEEAYRLIRETRFDLLLLDIKMPRVDGFELLQKLRDRSHWPIPVIVVSSSDLQADRTRAGRLGAIEYVHKTMEYADFKHDLKAALGRHGFC